MFLRFLSAGLVFATVWCCLQVNYGRQVIPKRLRDGLPGTIVEYVRALVHGNGGKMGEGRLERLVGARYFLRPLRGICALPGSSFPTVREQWMRLRNEARVRSRAMISRVGWVHNWQVQPLARRSFGVQSRRCCGRSLDVDGVYHGEQHRPDHSPV